MVEPFNITTRRHLLIAINASALSGPVLSARSSIAAADPAILAYDRIIQIEKAFMELPIDEENPAYRALIDEIEMADRQLAACRSKSPEGVRAKLDRMARLCAWEPEQAIKDCTLAQSIVSDVAQLMIV